MRRSGGNSAEQSGAQESRRGASSSARQGNVQRVLEALRIDGPTSQAALARRTHLSPATVNNIVKGLRGQGVAELRPINGRESLVALVANSGAVVTVEVNVTTLRASLFDFSSHTRHDRTLQLDTTESCEGGTPDQAIEMVHELVAAAGLRSADLAGVAVAMQAPVARATGVVTSWARLQLPAWNGVVIERALGEALAVPVVVDNDANLAALAEWTWGAGQGASDFLFVLCSAEVGGGLILDGKIFRGCDGLAGEIGHMVLERTGPVCRCGNRGCLSTFASERSILAALEAATGSPKQSLREVINDARNGDPASRLVLYEAGQSLGRAFANTAKVMAPSVIAVGGVLGDAGPLVFDGLQSSIEVNSLRAVSPSVEFRAGQLGADAISFGGVAALMTRLGQGVSTIPAWMKRGKLLDHS